MEVVPRADGKLDVRFEIPQRAITPGQAMVFYEGEKVLGEAGSKICPSSNYANRV